MHEETKQQTAVEFLSNEIKAARRLCDDLNMEMDIVNLTIFQDLMKEKQVNLQKFLKKTDLKTNKL